MNSDNKYRGLTNKGTPYLNSVLQVLFWTKDFREAVERHTSGNPEFIDHLLRALFDDLQSSDQRTADTSEIISKLGIDSVYEQRDAAEYLEKILRLTSPEVSQIFHGELTHKTICCKSHEEGNTKEQFWHLSFALLDSNTEDYSVVAGIKEYFRETNFSGDNQMYCDQCDDKVDAVTKCEITRHPEVLVLLLKRFDFDYHYMRYVKNNRPVGIPCTLHIPQGQTYELYAVVDHRGDLRSGHYSAIIKSQDDERWFNFNDDWVTMLHPHPFQWGDTERSYSAYLLFYRINKPIGGRPPASSGSCDQSQTPDETIKREEGEEAAEVGNGTEQAVSIERNEEPGHGDMASVESNRRGLSPDASQDSRDYVRQGDSHGDLLAARGNKQEKDELEIMKNDEEKMAGNAEADDQIEKRGLLSVEAQQDCDGAGLDVGQKQPQKDLEATVIHNIPVKSKDVCGDIERNRDSDRSTGHEESQRRGHTSTKYTDMDPKCQVSEGLDDVRQNIIKDQGGKQEAEQDDGLTPVRVTQQGDKEKMEPVVKDDNRGNVDADEQTSRRGKLLTKNDDVRKYNWSKHHEGCKQRDSGRLYKRSEQQTEEKMKQKRKDDEPAQRKGTSTTKPSLNEGAEDQHKKRLADVGQNSPEQETTVTHTTHRGGVKKRVREQEHKRDEHTEITEDTSLVQVGSGSKRPTAGQGAGRVNKTEEIHVMKTQKKKKKWRHYFKLLKIKRKDKMKQNRTTGFVEKKTKSSCFITKQHEPDDPPYGSSH